MSFFSFHTFNIFLSSCFSQRPRPSVALFVTDTANRVGPQDALTLREPYGTGKQKHHRATSTFSSVFALHVYRKKKRKKERMKTSRVSLFFKVSLMFSHSDDINYPATCATRHLFVITERALITFLIVFCRLPFSANEHFLYPSYL